MIQDGAKVDARGWIVTIGNDPPLCGSSMCSGSKAHLSSSTCFFCLRFARRCNRQNYSKFTEGKNWKSADWSWHQFMGIYEPVHLNGKRSWQEHTPREQQRQRRCRPAIHQQSNAFFLKYFREQIFLPRSTRQLPWCRPPGAGNCLWMPARERKCQNCLKAGKGNSARSVWCWLLIYWGWCELLLSDGLRQRQKCGEEMWVEQNGHLYGGGK